MATEIQPEKPLELMMKNLKVDPSSEISNCNLAAPKDGIPYDATSCISSSGDATTSSIKGSDVDQDSLMAEQVMYYPSGYGYYYPGLNGSIGEWDAQGQYLGGNGLEIQYPVIQADNSAVFYYPPGVQFAYNSYTPYFPNAMIGMDGQYFCQQPPLPPSPVFPQHVPSPGYYPSPVLHGSEAFPVYQWDGYPLYGDVAHGNGFGVGSTVPAAKPKVSSLTNTLASAKSSPPKSGISVEDTSPVLDLPPNNKPLKPANKISQHGSGFPAATVLAKGYFPIPKFQEKESLRFPNNSINLKSNARDWMGSEKLKARGKANVVSDFDLYNEQNRGPRTSGAKNALVSGVDQVESVENGTGNSLTTIIIKDDYNLPDFPTKYDHALFYVIKSYSEDDIHKSIKYNVWASTSNGNKRLDGAYQDAQQKREEKGCNCPVFLFFSVNASGQFCGVAEMIGRVDFNKSMDFWQQDKWNGFFPVKWHIIKDVPNPQFRHIILENNDNKPVTNSRDTQEVKFLQGIEILNIFKNYSAKTSILDDFGFYEGRQKAMQDKRIRPLPPHVEHSQKKPEEGVVQVVDAVSDLKPVVVASDNTTTEFATGHKKKEVEVVSGVEE